MGVQEPVDLAVPMNSPSKGEGVAEFRVTAPTVTLTDRMSLIHCRSCSRLLKRREKMLLNCF